MGNYPKAIGPYSPFIKSGNLLFCSGQIGLEPESGKLVEGGIEEETIQVIKNIKGMLSENNLDLTNVVKTTIFLDDIINFGRVNEIYGEYFIGKPARSTVQVAKLPAGAKIEIEVIASFE